MNRLFGLGIFTVLICTTQLHTAEAARRLVAPALALAAVSFFPGGALSASPEHDLDLHTGQPPSLMTERKTVHSVFFQSCKEPDTRDKCLEDLQNFKYQGTHPTSPDDGYYLVVSHDKEVYFILGPNGRYYIGGVTGYCKVAPLSTLLDVTDNDLFRVMKERGNRVYQIVIPKEPDPTITE